MDDWIRCCILPVAKCCMSNKQQYIIYCAERGYLKELSEIQNEYYSVGKYHHAFHVLTLSAKSSNIDTLNWVVYIICNYIASRDIYSRQFHHQDLLVECLNKMYCECKNDLYLFDYKYINVMFKVYVSYGNNLKIIQWMTDIYIPIDCIIYHKNMWDLIKDQPEKQINIIQNNKISNIILVFRFVDSATKYNALSANQEMTHYVCKFLFDPYMQYAL